MNLKKFTSKWNNKIDLRHEGSLQRSLGVVPVTGGGPMPGRVSAQLGEEQTEGGVHQLDLLVLEDGRKWKREF